MIDKDSCYVIIPCDWQWRRVRGDVDSVINDNIPVPGCSKVGPDLCLYLAQLADYCEDIMGFRAGVLYQRVDKFSGAGVEVGAVRDRLVVGCLCDIQHSPLGVGE